MQRFVRVCLVTSVVVLAVNGIASASTIWVRDNPTGGVTSSGTPGGVFLDLTESRPLGTVSGGSFEQLPVGVFDLQTSPTNTDPWTTFYTFCLEPTQDLSLPGEFTIQSLTGYANLSSTDITWLQLLWGTEFNNTLTNATDAAAFQFIVWELVVDTTVDLSAGQVQLGDAADLALANLWLQALQNGDWTQSTGLLGLTSPNGQDLLIPVPAGNDQPVPEPASLVLLGSGLVGVALRYRRRRQV